MTKAVCRRIEKAVQARLAFLKVKDVATVKVTEDPIARGYYVIHVSPREYVTATETKAILSAWEGIFLIRAQLNENGAPELIFQATRRREL